LTRTSLSAWLLFVAGWIGLVTVGLLRLDTNVEDFFPWLPDGSQAGADYVAFLERFGTDDALLVSWDGCQLNDPRIDQLAATLRAECAENIATVITAEEQIERLTAAPSSLTRDEALSRLEGVLIGKDHSSTLLLLLLSDAGMRNRRETVLSVLEVAESELKLPEEQLRLGGHPYLGYFSSQITLTSMKTLTVPVAMISTILAWFCLRRFLLMLITLASAGAAAVTSVALISWLGYRLNGLLTALPSVVYVVTVSGAIHVVNYALVILADRAGDEPSPQTLSPEKQQFFRTKLRARALRPCLLSSVSTGLGCLSLFGSSFPAIREFGLLTAIGVGLSFLVQIWLIPILLATVADRIPLIPRRSSGALQQLLAVIVRYHTLVIVFCILVTAVLVAPLMSLEGQFTQDQLFAEDSQFVQNIRWLEKHIGPIDATEVILSLDTSVTPRFSSRYHDARRVAAALGRLEGVRSVQSAVSFLPSIEGIAARSVIAFRLKKARAELLETPLLAEEGDTEYWRITLRTSFFDNATRDGLNARVQQSVADVTQDWDQTPGVVCTGGSEIFHETQQTVLSDFVASLTLAWGLILLMMVVGLRSLRGGMLSIVPTVLPTISVFGVLAWLGGSIDVGVTVAACIAMGIAVDDSAHLLLAFQSASRNGADRISALQCSFYHCAIAMCQTSVICGLAMLPYTTATLIYLSRFGLLLPILMAAALFGALIFLPAVIASPAGVVFEKRQRGG
jgi:predicted RND superfamily exporter protein